MKPVDISSTVIREMVKNGKDISRLVPGNIQNELIKLYSS
jgi:phosphopantetheine adenylyltransferase